MTAAALLDVDPVTQRPVVRRAAVALTVGELDPTGRSGITVDLLAFAALAVRGACLPTFLGSGAGAAEPVAPEAVRRHWERVSAELPLDAVKLGRLGGESAIRSAAEWLAEAAPPRLVCDPGFLDPTGEPRVGDAALAAWKATILPLCHLVLVNTVEAERLFGRGVEDRRAMLEAAKRLFDLGPKLVVVTGGRPRDGHPIDLLYDGTGTLEIGTDRVPGLRLPHTGGVHSAFVTAELARGASAAGALEMARTALSAALERPARLGLEGAAVEPFARLYTALGLDPAPIAVPVAEAPGEADR